MDEDEVGAGGGEGEGDLLADAAGCAAVVDLMGVSGKGDGGTYVTRAVFPSREKREAR